VRTVKINRKESLKKLKEESHRRVGVNAQHSGPLCAIKCRDEKQVTTIRENSNRNICVCVCVCILLYC